MFPSKYLLVLFLVFLPTIKSRYTPSLIKEEPQYFLDGKVRPLHYDLQLMTHVENCEKGCVFEGKMKITIKVNEDRDNVNDKVTQIQLNSHTQVRISSCSLEEEDGSAIPVTFSFNNATEIVTVNTKNSQALDPKKTYFLIFEYEGSHNDKMFGFYRSVYQTPEGKRRWLLTTQFEPNDARSAFPCFDEPQYKATFEIAVTISQKAASEGYHVLFNTPLISKSSTQNGVTYRFSKTPYRISTYLIAFIVSDFKATDPIKFVSDYGPEKNTPKDFKTWGEKSYIDDGDAFIPQIAGVSAIKILSDYLGIGYAYPKMDQVGIPDFAAGAMENWGLVTYRERMLFNNDRITPVLTKQGIVKVIAHELTHQWFGDLVTLHSWDYVWLNEGFATYFAYFVSEKVAESALNSSDWDTMGQMIVAETQLRAFESDALQHTRPLSFKITVPAIAHSYFDSISYAKGASVIRMWSHILGEEVFRRGLNIYLNARKEDNSVPGDLLKSFEKACNETNCIDAQKYGLVSELLDAWHSTAGYPVINVEKVLSSTYRITQEQFYWYEHKNGSKTSNKWNVPITYSTSSSYQFGNTRPYFWLKSSGGKVDIAFQNSPKWIILNNQHTGYYRVNYDVGTWNALIQQLRENHDYIHEYNRAQLINDAFSFGRSTYKDYKVDYEIPLNLVRYLKKEKEFVPWDSALNAFSFLDNKMTSSKYYKHFQLYVMSLLKNRFDSLSLLVSDEDSHLDRILRMGIGSRACSLGYKPCVEQAVALYKNPQSINPDVKPIVYCIAIREGGDEVWDHVWKLYEESDYNIEQTIYLGALGCSLSSKKLFELLNKTITPGSGIRRQDYAATFASVYKGGNVRAALNFLSEKFEDIAKNYNGIDPLGDLLIGISAKMNSESELNSMLELQDKIMNSPFETVKVASVSMGKAIEIIESNLNWIKLKRGSIEKWLSSNAPQFMHIQ